MDLQRRLSRIERAHQRSPLRVLPSAQTSAVFLPLWDHWDHTSTVVLPLRDQGVVLPLFDRTCMQTSAVFLPRAPPHRPTKKVSYLAGSASLHRPSYRFGAVQTSAVFLPLSGPPKKVSYLAGIASLQRSSYRFHRDPGPRAQVMCASPALLAQLGSSTCSWWRWRTQMLIAHSQTVSRSWTKPRGCCSWTLKPEVRG